MDSAGKSTEDGGPGVWPLVLILGQNGSGKTTIIECLRYATTGDCPPGSGGGRSFVHDPKMASEVNVTGTVKLLFRGTDKKPYLISRSIQATQKPKTISIKTLDGTFMDYLNRSSLSMKCADINSTVLDHMGVTKPILNYVIFCHQEDSNWPLDEGSKVKDKFDEIFASAKYKDCLKKIKDVRAAHMAEKRVDDTELRGWQEDKKMAKEKRKKLKADKLRREALEEEMKEFDGQLKPIREKLQEIDESQKGLNNKKAELTGYEAHLKNASSAIKETKANLKDYKGSLDQSEEEIESERRSLDKKAREKKRQISEKTTEASELKAELESLNNSKNTLAARLGELSNKQVAYGEKKKDFVDKLRASAEDFGLTSVQSKVAEDDESMDRAMASVSKAVGNADKKYRGIEQSCDAAVEQQTEKIGQLQQTQAAFKEKKAAANSGLIESKKEIAKINSALRTTEEASDQLEEIQAKCEEAKKDLEKMRGENSLSDLRSKIASMKGDIKKLDAEIEKLRVEKGELDEHQQTLAKLTSKKEDKKTKKEKIDKLLASHRMALNEIEDLKEVSADIPKLNKKLREKQEEFQREVKDGESNRMQLKNDKAIKEKEKGQLEKDIKELDEKIREFEEEAEGLLSEGNDDLEKELTTAKAEVEKSQEELSRKSANKFTFREHIEFLESSIKEKNPGCPTCMRAFENEAAARKLIKELQKKIDKIPDKVKRIEERLKKNKERVEDLVRLLPSKKQADENRAQADTKRRKLKELGNDLKKNKTNTERNEEELDKSTTALGVCIDMADDIGEAYHLHVEVQLLDESIRELETENAGLSSCRSLEEFKKEEETVHRRHKALRQGLDMKENTVRNIEEKQLGLEREINALEAKRLDIEKKQQEKVALTKRKDEMEKKVAEFKEEQGKQDKELEKLEESIKTETKEKNRLVAEKTKQLNAAKKDLDRIKAAETALEALSREIADYREANNEEELEKVNSEIKSTNRNISTKKEAVMECEEEKRELEAFVSEQDMHARQLRDLLNLRQKEREEEEFEQKVASVKKQIELMDDPKVNAQRERLLAQNTKLYSERERRRGTIGELGATIRELERELQSDKLRLAEEKCREKSVALRCREHVINDLNKYYKALDWSIMQYHRQRMTVINKIVKEMWRATYRGNDIDYIEIKTDESDVSAGADKRKVYNYRVSEYVIRVLVRESEIRLFPGKLGQTWDRREIKIFFELLS